MRRRIVILSLALLSILATACGSSSGGGSFTTDARITLDTYAGLVEQHLSSVLIALAAVAKTTDAQSGQWSLIRPALADIASRTGTTAAVWFVEPDGSYYTVAQGLMGSPLSDRGYFPRLMAGEDVLGDLVVSKSTGEDSAIVAAPIRSDGTVIGGLGASVDLTAVASMVSRTMRLPSTVVFYAIDSQGKTALHSETMNIFAFPSQEGSPSLAKAVRQMLHTGHGTVTYSYKGKRGLPA